MKNVWYSGVKSQATSEIGSRANLAGSSGMAAAGVGVAVATPLPLGLAPDGAAHAARISARRTIPTRGSRRTMSERRREAVTESSCESSDGVVAAGMPWVAPGDPLRAHPAALEQPVLVDRLLGVSRACRLVAAAGRHPGEHDAIEPDEPDPDRLEPDPDRVHDPACPPSTPPRWRSRRSVSTRVRWSASTIAGRAMIRTSQPGWNEGAIALSPSRSRRRTRLRTTAPPSFRPVARPNRVVSRSVRRNRTVRSGWDRTVPACIAAKSCGRESITSRGVLVPRPVVRPSVAFDPEPAWQQRRGGRRPSASGRGSHAPSRDAASWADRSASSGLDAILSVGPRVDSDPERHTNAPAL